MKLKQFLLLLFLPPPLQMARVEFPFNLLIVRWSTNVNKPYFRDEIKQHSERFSRKCVFGLSKQTLTHTYMEFLSIFVTIRLEWNYVCTFPWKIRREHFVDSSISQLHSCHYYRVAAI